MTTSTERAKAPAEAPTMLAPPAMAVPVKDAEPKAAARPTTRTVRSDY